MQRLHYTGESFLVADDICTALLDYASALADAQLSDVVEIPIIDEAGLPVQAELLLGPASQLYASQADHMPESADGEVVDGLRARAARVRSGRPPTKAPDESTA